METEIFTEDVQKLLNDDEFDAMKIKEIRRASGLSQSKFADLISVSVDTLRNWEQGRRSPTGPAKALLRAIANDPQHVLQALNR
ncbi:helix-turn-helix domain-containing protein [Escherichia coli]|nr:helix-turn-helix domain-containing protein [Escherichia coli]